ncbi:MAG: MFS transporter [Bdellovibrionota bacterium]
MEHRKWWVLAAVACGTFMATLDSSIVNIALPTLTKELGAELYQIKWVVIAYLLVITCLLLPVGRLSDQYGRKFIFQSGFLIFVGGSTLCGLAPSLTGLVVFRMLQAAGAAMLMANGPAIITAAFPSRERGAALGTMAMVVSAGLLSGPSIGGLLISALGWRSIFLVNIPVGLLGVFLVQIYLKADSHRPRAPFDWAGAVLQSLFLLSFMVLFDPPHISVSGSTPFSVPHWLIAAVVALLGFILIRVEAEAKAPLLDLSLMRNRVFWTANLAGFLIFVSFSAVTVLMPFFLEEVMHFAPHKAGLFMTAIPVTIFIVAPISGRISDKVGSQELSFGGALVGVIGLFGMSGIVGAGLQPTTAEALIVLVLSSIGLATGLFQSPNNNSIMGAVPPAKLGVASALLATVRNLGLVTGTGIATGLFTWRMRLNADFVSAFHFTLAVSGMVGIGAMLASLGKGRGLRTAHHDQHPVEGI